MNISYSSANSIIARWAAAYASVRGLALAPLILLTSHCKSDDDAVNQGSNASGTAGKASGSAGSNHIVSLGGQAGDTASGTSGRAGSAVTDIAVGASGPAGGAVHDAGSASVAGAHGGGVAGVSTSSAQAAAGSAGYTQRQGGGGVGGRYCRATNPARPTSLFQCPADYCDAISAAIRRSDVDASIFSGATVRAGRCAAPADSFESVYFGSIVGTTECFYRSGAFVGQVDWGDSQINIEGCSIFLGPVVFGEFPESALKQSPATCGGLTNYRPLSNPSGGSAGASSVAEGFAGGTSGGAAGAGSGLSGVAGAAGAPSRSCYQAATATCGPC